MTWMMDSMMTVATSTTTTAASICLQGGWVVAIDNDVDGTSPTPSSLSNCSWGGLLGGMGGMSTLHDDNGDEVGPTYEVIISTIITPSIVSHHDTYPHLIVVVVVLDAIIIMISSNSLPGHRFTIS